MNFAALSRKFVYATTLFDQENEYKFKMPGFHFNTNETMKITVYSKFDKNYEFDGIAMHLPTSVGDVFFNGYVLTGKLPKQIKNVRNSLKTTLDRKNTKSPLVPK
ncbi:UNVERIFIED_CONTAM: hypothetical protein RMT77_019981 [Armadillidium vulgare]